MQNNWFFRRKLSYKAREQHKQPIVEISVQTWMNNKIRSVSNSIKILSLKHANCGTFKSSNSQVGIWIRRIKQITLILFRSSTSEHLYGINNELDTVLNTLHISSHLIFTTVSMIIVFIVNKKRHKEVSKQYASSYTASIILWKP